MKDYYKILNIDSESISKKNIKPHDLDTFYKNKINRFKNLPFLTKDMKDDIKDIKEAYYVLSNNVLRNKYNEKYKKKEETIIANDDNKYIDNTKICNRLFSLTFA
jgi:hypothetical protein